jgi:glucose/arabinose dehydrogenase
MAAKRIVAWVIGVPLVLAAGLVGYVAVFGLSSLLNPGPKAPAVAAAQAGVTVTTVAQGLDTPWGLAFLPDGRMLVTERIGQLRIVAADGSLSAPVTGVPAVLAEGQGGLLDVVLDPDFATTGLVYLSYAEPDAANPALAGTAVARATLEGNALTGLTVIWRQTPKREGANHWGSRLVFAPAPAGAPQSHVLFITTGDRFEGMDQAQDLTTTIGKTLRIYPDGTIPADNPFVGRAAAKPEIWSYGHRNMQGAALDPRTGTLWTHEHGPQGGDELNPDLAGRNYGWPVITFGKNYLTGTDIKDGRTDAPGMEQPVHKWVPSIAPSGMAFYTGSAYPQWSGSLFLGSLAHMRLVRLELDGTRVAKEEQLLGDLNERIRDVRQGPDGKLYLLTDSPEGRILRLDPKA